MAKCGFTSILAPVADPLDHATCRAMIVLGSLLHIALLLASLPARRTAESYINILVSQGERALMAQHASSR